MKKRMKLPNNFGSVYKLSGKRRKPYVACISEGYNKYGKRLRKIIGYAESYEKGLDMLSEYRKNPYDLDFKNITFEDVFYKLEKELENLVDKEKMSKSNLKNIRAVFNNQLLKIHNKPLLELKTREMQDIIDNSNVGKTTRGYIKTTCSKVFEYAIIELEMPFNSNPADKLKIGEKEKSEKHFPFTDEERDILWKNTNNDIVKMILIYLYSSMRPNELLKIKISNIHLEEEYMIGGSKTKAGKNRIIPIHKKILPFIKYFYNPDNEYLINIKYDSYAKEFKKIILLLNLNPAHTPYNTRHDFATRIKRLNINEYIIKRIMGHSITDITEGTYTHRSIKELVEAVNLLD